MAELQGLERLLAKGLTQEEEALARRYYSDKERDSMDASDFCGPHETYPIKTAEDVKNAARLIGHADDPESVKSCVIGKAKEHGWAIPDAWEEGNDKQDRAMQVSDRIPMSFPLVRIDATKREVWGQATAEVPDSYGTIFGYYPEAWKKWRGNIREQHDGKKAVGNRIELECNDTERAIYVGGRVSRGAQDTWLKVEDNVLTGYSASVIPDPEFGTNTAKWPKKEYQGKEYPYLPRYTVAELSLVDNPACPGCDIQIVRADGFATDILDTTEETPENTPSPIAADSSPLALDRAGARLSSDSRAALHQMRDQAMSLCGCEECAGMQSSNEPDGDEDMERKLTSMIERALSPVYARLQGIAGTLARSNATPNNINIESIVSGAITRAVEANEASLSKVRAELSAVKETVDRIDNTPMPGAPIMNSATTRPPVADKSLPTDPVVARSTNGGAAYDAMVQQFAKMSQAGQFHSLDDQLAAAGRVLATQPPPPMRR